MTSSAIPTTGSGEALGGERRGQARWRPGRRLTAKVAAHPSQGKLSSSTMPLSRWSASAWTRGLVESPAEARHDGQQAPAVDGHVDGAELLAELRQPEGEALGFGGVVGGAPQRPDEVVPRQGGERPELSRPVPGLVGELERLRQPLAAPAGRSVGPGTRTRRRPPRRRGRRSARRARRPSSSSRAASSMRLRLKYETPMLACPHASLSVDPELVPARRDRLELGAGPRPGR